MGGLGKLYGGLALCLIGVLGVSVACGLPMWRETSFVGANIVTAQTIWDGLWMACTIQSTGQMQCKKPTSPLTLTTDLKAGRALTLLSIITGLLGFIIALLGGGVFNCSGAPQDDYISQSSISSQNKAALLGGVLCIIAGILCLVSAIWSAAVTINIYNNPLVVVSLRRQVGTSIYIGLVSGVLLLLGGIILCSVCTRKPSPPQIYNYQAYAPYTYSTASQLSKPSRLTTTRSDVVRSSVVFGREPPNFPYGVQRSASQVYGTTTPLVNYPSLI